MAHGGYSKRTAAVDRKKPANSRTPKTLAVNNKSKPKTTKAASIKNQIRSTERMLRKDLPAEVKEAQQKKLEELKKEQETLDRVAKERKIFLRNRKVRFFERRKIDRRIKQLEKQQSASSDQAQKEEIADQLVKLKDDLEYVRFFPKTEKYVPLFIGGDETVEKRNSLRKQIKANLIAAAASGKELEETANEDDGLLDQSDDDFFLNGSSSDEGEADDEQKDKSARKQASGALSKAASGMSNEKLKQKQIPPPPSRKPLSSSSGAPPPPSRKPFSSGAPPPPYRKPFSSGAPPPPYRKPFSSGPPPPPYRKPFSSGPPPPRGHPPSRKPFSSPYGAPPPAGPASRKPFSSSLKNESRLAGFSGNRAEIPTLPLHNTSFRKRGPEDFTTGNSSNSTLESDVRKPKRKRRPKKKQLES